MSRFRFLHAADLHLGSPFASLAIKDREIAERFARATRDAFSQLVSRTIEAQARFMVVAGDVYDGEWKDNSIGLFFNREIARLDRAGIPVFLLKGNHDADSVVTRAIGMPDSVRHFETRKPSSFMLDDIGVALHGQGFAERAASDNLALSYPPPVPGRFNIGVLHTSLTGRPPHADYAPCSMEDLRSRGYDYWALGHVHDFEVVARDPYIVFPGNLQGRNIREAGAKGAVLVSVEDGRVVDVERVIVDQARFAALDVDICDCGDVHDVLRAAERALAPLPAQAGGMLHALRLRLVGATPLRRALLASRAQLAEEMQAACHRADADFWLEKLVIDVTEPQQATGVAQDLDELARLLDAVLAEPDFQAEAENLLAEIRARMPGGAGEVQALSGEPVEALLSEAREFALARASGEGGA